MFYHHGMTRINSQSLSMISSMVCLLSFSCTLFALFFSSITFMYHIIDCLRFDPVDRPRFVTLLKVVPHSQTKLIFFLLSDYLFSVNSIHCLPIYVVLRIPMRFSVNSMQNTIMLCSMSIKMGLLRLSPIPSTWIGFIKKGIHRQMSWCSV
jgi:hypothetical protein